MLTQARLKELLDYNPETGVFTWRVSRHHRVRAGARAGSLSHNYNYVRIDGRLYKSSRLAWLYVTGNWPAKEIDHKNRVSHDDRWINLREATRAQNVHNRGLSRDNTSGAKGVIRVGGRWRARLYTGCVHLHLGYFASREDAAAAYRDAALRLHGEYAKVHGAEHGLE